MNWVNYILIPLAVALSLSIFWPNIQQLFGKIQGVDHAIDDDPSEPATGGIGRADAYRAVETLVAYFKSVPDEDGLRKAVEVGRALYPDPKAIDPVANRTKAKG
jgi:hypothetical protein